tara:strand:+ start:5842 stop:6531 length:690 start_codon:yes stop_codon:yes gene_type:complete
MKIIQITTCLIFILSSCSQEIQYKTPISDIEKVSYSIGVNVATALKSRNDLDTISAQSVAKAFNDVIYNNDLDYSLLETDSILNDYFVNVANKKTEKEGKENAEAGAIFLKENSTKEGVTTTESGLQYEILVKGNGNTNPKITDQVTVNYHGTLINGNIFDSSISRGEPAIFPIGQVIPGWVEGIQLMSVGDKFKFYIPSVLAYGENPPSNNIGANETLIFEVELLKIN